MSTENPPALTQFSSGAGCGCKIAPHVLKEILHTDQPETTYKNLIVGNKTNDDAAVYDLGNGQGLIATTDFFTPVVDDAYDFGRVAAANAISDVYAMGGSPTMAIAILGWPVDKLSPQLARRVIEGARTICEKAGIPLAGGHSISTTEPVFGLSVNGLIDLRHLKRNDGATAGDVLFLTKPLGTGILSTAQKRNLLRPGDQLTLIAQLTALNEVGEKLGTIRGITAMTDVTGFGLMGHVLEMAKGSGLTAMVHYDQVPKMAGLDFYLAQNTIPDATYRNWNAYNKDVQFDAGVNMAEAFSVLPDPQTNGGLLVSVNAAQADEVAGVLKKHGVWAAPIGRMEKMQEKSMRVVK